MSFESRVQACFPLQNITASRIVNVRLCPLTGCCSDPEMGQIISSSKLFRKSFNRPLGDPFCFPLCLLGDGSRVGGEDSWCTAFVELMSGSEVGKGRSLLKSACKFVLFAPSWWPFAKG